jgi:hypothetical protein
MIRLSEPQNKNHISNPRNIKTGNNPENKNIPSENKKTTENKVLNRRCYHPFDVNCRNFQSKP